MIPAKVELAIVAAGTVPAREDIPPEYAGLLDWYQVWSQDSIEELIKNDPLLAL